MMALAAVAQLVAAAAAPNNASDTTAGWVGIVSAAHSTALTACAATDGGPCATHSNITLLDPSSHGWWNGSTTGDEICARLGRPNCSRMIAFDCHKSLSCSRPICTNSTPQPCGGSNPGHFFCQSDASPGQCELDPPPTTCPPCDSVALAEQVMTLCGAHTDKKLCEDCAGGCAACPAPFRPPKAGVKALPGYQGGTTPLSKSMPYCDTTKTIDERLDWLVANMTLAEKVRAISPQPDLGNTCGTVVCGKPSIGLSKYAIICLGILTAVTVANQQTDS